MIVYTEAAEPGQPWRFIACCFVGDRSRAAERLRLTESFLINRQFAMRRYETDPYDAGSFIAVAPVLASIGFLASQCPARRAARTDPASYLRDQ